VYDQLVAGSGPFAPDAIAALAPTPELLALLLKLVELPWPEFEEEERAEENDAPVYALILLGLVGDERAVPLIIDVLHHASKEDWDAITEIVPRALGAIGAKALPAVLAEIERMEREEELDARKIDAEDLDASTYYVYWSLVIAVEQIALNHPEVRATVAPFVEARIRDSRFDRPARKRKRTLKPVDDFEMPTPAEIWLDFQITLRYEELQDALEDFFDRQGPSFVSLLFDDRETVAELMASEKPAGNARERLITDYTRLRAGENIAGELDVDELDDDYDEDVDDDELDDDEFEDDDDEPQEPYVRPEPKVGRNDPCPCGSGKKYKKCHGA
jgi:hypothetical protein